MVTGTELVGIKGAGEALTGLNTNKPLTGVNGEVADSSFGVEEGERVNPKGLVESVFEALGKPGGVQRQLMLDLLTKATIDPKKLGQVITGDHDMGPRAFQQALAERMGFDKNEFIPDSPTLAAIQDFVVDVNTSHADGVFGLPGKFLKLSKALKAIKASRVAKKAAPFIRSISRVKPDDFIEGVATRGAIGAGLGASSINSDDDFLSGMGKVASVAGTVSLGPTVIKPLLNSGMNAGEKGVDALTEFFHAERLKKVRESGVRMPVRVAEKISDGFDEKAIANKRLLIQGQEEVEQDLYESLTNPSSETGLKALSHDDAILKVDEFHDIIGEGFSNTIKVRNAHLKKSVNVELNRLRNEADKAVPNSPSVTPEQIAEFKNELFMESRFDLFNKTDFLHKAKAAATKAGNAATNRMFEETIKFPEIFNATKAWGKTNRSLMKTFRNQTWKDLGKKSPHKSEFFEPIDTWMADLKQMGTNQGKENLAFRTEHNVPGRRSTLVETTREGMSLSEKRQLGAERFARLFMTKEEAKAKRLLNEFYHGERKGFMESLGSNGEDIDLKAFAVRSLEGFDALVKTMKTAHLVINNSWIVNNYQDNIVKAMLIDGGPGGFKIAQEQLNFIREDSTVRRLFKNMNEKSLVDFGDEVDFTKMHAEERDIHRVAGDLGLIDKTKFTDFGQTDALPGESILDKFNKEKVSPRLNFMSNDPASGSLPTRLAKKGWDHLIGGGAYIQDKMWGSVGRIGSAMENTAKLESFRSVMGSMHIKYPDGMKYIKKHGYSKAFSQSNLDIAKSAQGGVKAKGLIEAKRAMQEAADIVTRVFFDYGDVRAFNKVITRRAIPYSTFYLNNMDLWLHKIGDSAGIKSVAKAAKFQNAGGRALTREEREGQPDYLLKNIMKIHINDDGSRSLVSNPGLSMRDGLENIFAFSQWDFTPIANKLNPPIKTFVEQGLDHEFFTGRPARVRGSKAKNILNSKLNIIPDSWLARAGILVDKETGRMSTNRPWTAIFDSMQKGLIPFPPADTLARIMREIKYEKRGIYDSVSNQVGMIKSRKILDKSEKRAKRSSRALKKRLNKRERQLLDQMNADQSNVKTGVR